MAEQHRAKPYVWAAVEKLGKNDLDMLNCVLELRARVEALEAAQPAQSNHPANPDSSLVERVAAAITGDGDDPINWKPEARAAIREVAAWLREENPLLGGNSSAFASMLERENN
jgi:ribonuclease HI